MKEPFLYRSLWIKRGCDPDGPWYPFIVVSGKPLCEMCRGLRPSVFPMPHCADHYIAHRADLHRTGTSTLERKTT